MWEKLFSFIRASISRKLLKTQPPRLILFANTPHAAAASAPLVFVWEGISRGCYLSVSNLIVLSVTTALASKRL